MTVEELILDKQVCDLLQDEIKSNHAHVQLQISFPTTDHNGNEVVSIIAEYDDEEMFAQLLNKAVNTRIELESLLNNIE